MCQGGVAAALQMTLQMTLQMMFCRSTQMSWDGKLTVMMSCLHRKYVNSTVAVPNVDNLLARSQV